MAKVPEIYLALLASRVLPAPWMYVLDVLALLTALPHYAALLLAASRCAGKNPQLLALVDVPGAARVKGAGQRSLSTHGPVRVICRFR